MSKVANGWGSSRGHFTCFRYFSNGNVFSSDTFERKHFEASVNANTMSIFQRGMKHSIYVQDETGGGALHCW